MPKLGIKKMNARDYLAYSQIADIHIMRKLLVIYCHSSVEKSPHVSANRRNKREKIVKMDI